MAAPAANPPSYQRVISRCRTAQQVLRTFRCYSKIQKGYSAELKLVTAIEKIQLLAIGGSLVLQLAIEEDLPKTDTPIPPEIEALIAKTNEELEATTEEFVSDLSSLVNSLCNADSIVARVNDNLETALFSPDTKPGKAIMAKSGADFAARAASPSGRQPSGQDSAPTSSTGQ